MTSWESVHRTWSRSLDGGQSWSHPRVFDDRGVWPRMLTLANGITLASYGRPGLFVRATADPAGLEWEQRVVVVEPAERRQDTCSYSALLALDDRTALLAYSDFRYPGRARAEAKEYHGAHGHRWMTPAAGCL